jgi:hypothetical protein
MTHAYEGGHPDHDSAAFAVAALQVRSRFVHLEFAGYHQGPDGRLVTNRFAACTTTSVRFRLTPAEQRLKRLMLCAFRSQCRTLQPFGVTEEWLRVAPTYDFTRPPNGGRVWYEQFPWGMRAAEWTARVARLRAQGTGQERLRC